MRKIIMFLVMLLIFPIVNAAYDNYVLCRNQTMEESIASFNEIRLNGSNSMIQLQNTNKELVIYNKTDVWDNYINITLDARITGTVSGLALNRSSYSSNYFWISHLDHNSTYKINASGNITQNITFAGTGIIRSTAVDTIDGSRLFILDADMGRITEID